MNKTCNKCGESKPLSEYYANPKAADNLHLSCKSCHYAKTRLVLRLKKGFASLKPDRCECCGGTSEALQVDHDHKTSMFRGFICQSCNMTIGRAGDSYEAVLKKGLDPMFLDYLTVAEWRMGSTAFDTVGRRKGKKV